VRPAARRLECGGESLTVAEWAARLGVHPNTIEKRLANPAWTVERALSTGSLRPGSGRPVNPGSLAAQARALGITRQGLWKRRRRGAVEPAIRPCAECARRTPRSLDGEPCCARCAAELTTPVRCVTHGCGRRAARTAQRTPGGDGLCRGCRIRRSHAERRAAERRAA
jgi:hypothetical protein